MVESQKAKVLEKKYFHNQLLIFVLLILPFILNDLTNIFVNDYITYLLIDYIFVKLSPLLFIIYLLRHKYITYPDIGIKKLGVFPFIALTLLMIIIATTIDQIGWRFWMKVLPKTQLGGFPPVDTNSLLFKFDLYIGMFLVAIVEEIIFRGFSFTVLQKKLNNIPITVILSSLLFGIIHWSLGVHAIINTAIIGAIFMIVMWKTRSVIPLIIAHFLVDYIAFSGIIPGNLFDFIY